MTSRLLRVLVVVFAVGAIVAGAGQALASKPGGGCPLGRPGCICPQYVDPVVCPDGCTYYNSCAATCAGERGCVSTGGGPTQ